MGRRGPSGAPIERDDPWQLRLLAPQLALRPDAQCLLVAFPFGAAENLMLAPALRELRATTGVDVVLAVPPAVAASGLWQASQIVAEVRALPEVVPAPNVVLAEAAARLGADQAFWMPEPLVPWQGRVWGMPYLQRTLPALLGVSPESFSYEVPLLDEHRAAAARLWQPGASPTVALDLNGRNGAWSLREYQRLAALLRARGFRVLHCLPQPGDEAAATVPVDRAAGDISTADLPNDSLLARAAAFERCVAIAAVDSASLHLAAALGKPAAGLFPKQRELPGHVFEDTLALLFGSFDAERVIAALERVPGGIGRRSVPLRNGTVKPAHPTVGDIDVVVAAYNEEGNLPRLLASLHANGVAPDAITVVDKGSADRTSAVAREFGARLLTGGRNSSEQRNMGAHATTRPFLAFLDADMELVPGQVAEWARLLAEVHCLTIPEASMPIDRLGRARSLERSFIGANPEIESARIFAREVFERAGGYRVDLYGCEDWALSDSIVSNYPSGRAGVALLHHEGALSTPRLFRKYRRYGRGYFALFRENRGRFVRHARPLRREMLKAIVAAGRRDPGLLLSWLQFRTITYTGGLLGFIDAALDAARGRG